MAGASGRLAKRPPAPSAELALGLLVLLVRAAPSAVLLDIQSVRVVLLVFHGGVIAALAIATCQRDDDSVFLLGQGRLSCARNRYRDAFSVHFWNKPNSGAVGAEIGPKQKHLLGGVKSQYIGV